MTLRVAVSVRNKVRVSPCVADGEGSQGADELHQEGWTAQPPVRFRVRFRDSVRVRVRVLIRGQGEV